MATRKKIEIFLSIENDKDFNTALERNKNKLICAEIYSGMFGFCTALEKLFTHIKFELSKDDDIVCMRVLADEVELVSRLRNQSEPFFMFIYNKKVTNVYRGVNTNIIEDMFKKELQYFRQEAKGFDMGRRKYEIDEPTPSEMSWVNARSLEVEQEQQDVLERQTKRQKVRKRHRAELMAPHLGDIDFVLYWPQCTHAHPELYERWNENNLIMVGREELELDKEQALDILYAGDAPVNEASIHALTTGKSLVICLKSLDPVDIVALVRKILYQDSLTEPTERENEKATVRLSMTAFENYKIYSPSREKIIQKRKEERLQRINKRRESRIRRLAELQRIARQAREDAIEAKKQELEHKKMELLKTGKMAELDKLNAEPENFEDVDIVIPEALSDSSEEESEVVDDPEEYFPPPGLPIPGFYSPPNDIAKANGLAILFPRLVTERVTPQEEFLPPHVLVMLHMHKRHQAIDHMLPFQYGIIHMGIFKATTPYDAIHQAYSVKQFDAMEIDPHKVDDYKLCFMVSIKMDRPLLELMDLHPLHVSRDSITGGDECAALFRPDYGDEYDEFEDFLPKEVAEEIEVEENEVELSEKDLEEEEKEEDKENKEENVAEEKEKESEENAKEQEGDETEKTKEN